MATYTVYDFVGAITALNQGESVKVLAMVVGELLRGAGVLEEGVLYARSQLSDRDINEERGRREAESQTLAKLTTLRIRPDFRFGGAVTAEVTRVETTALAPAGDTTVAPPAS